MYDDLIKRLRNGLSCYGERCLSCPDKKHCTTKYQQEAADAIEELQKQLREEKVDNVNLTGWLAEEHANQCPYYIRNVHDRGDDSLCTKWECEVKVLPKWIPVTERLPENLKFVLAVEDGTVFPAHCEHYYGEEEVFVEWHDTMYYPANPTHWMPLPEPPKEKT